jgi:archaellum biogenesis protein FlaJ (TadC family)
MYNWFYRDGNPKPGITPKFQATSTFAGSISMWFLFFSILYNLYGRGADKKIILLPTIYFFLILVFFYLLLYNVFEKNEKYSKIYLEYKHLDAKERLKGRIITFSLVLLPLVLILIFGAMLPNMRLR